jgi:hypothetical protein
MGRPAAVADALATPQPGHRPHFKFTIGSRARRIAGLVSSGGSAVTAISPPSGGMMQVGRRRLRDRAAMVDATDRGRAGGCADQEGRSSRAEPVGAATVEPPRPPTPKRKESWGSLPQSWWSAIGTGSPFLQLPPAGILGISLPPCGPDATVAGRTTPTTGRQLGRRPSRQWAITGRKRVHKNPGR